MVSIDSLIERMANRGTSQRERMLRNKQRSFERYYNNTLNLHQCLVDGRPEELIF